MLIDTHCHLDFPEFQKDRDEVLQRARQAGIGYIINIGSSLEGSRRSVELAGQHDCVYATVGIHPHEADKVDKQALVALRELAGSRKVVGIGEIGLDYYKGYSKPENQKVLFTALLTLAKDLNLPVVIHNRDAQADTLKIIKPFLPLKVVVHCFSGDESFLRQCLSEGFFVSFTCNISYKKAAGLRDLLRLTPVERLFLETDAPFLPPEGMRGRRNEPSYVKYLADEVSKITGRPPEEIARITTQNAKQFFGLP